MRKFFSFLFLLVLVALAATAFFLTKTPKKSDASGLNQVLAGYAWSADDFTDSCPSCNPDATDGAGWISFSGTTTDSTATLYSVTLDGNGDLTGDAWSHNYGWIQFGGLSGFPGTSGDGTTASNAHVNANGALVGWVRLLNYGQNPHWDGWISLSGNVTGGGTYGVKLDSTTGKLSGYAWGGGDSSGGEPGVGWVDFSRVLAQAKLEVSCVLTSNPVPVNQPVLWTAVKFNGNDPLTYTWSVDGGATEPGNPSSVTRTYPTAGTHTATLAVTDATGQTVPPLTCNPVTVNDPADFCQLPDKTFVSSLNADQTVATPDSRTKKFYDTNEVKGDPGSCELNPHPLVQTCEQRNTKDSDGILHTTAFWNMSKDQLFNATPYSAYTHKVCTAVPKFGQN